MATAGDVHTVFVVGAGASLAEAFARRPVQASQHPPLDADFFSRVARYRSTAYRDNAGHSLYAAVQRTAAGLGVEVTGTSLEDHLGRFYFNFQHNPLRASVRDYFTLVDLYAREVIGTTEWMIGHRASRRSDELLRRMLQVEIASGHRISIVTFNIDLLIENTLQILASSRPGAPWSLQHAYNFAKPFPPVSTAGQTFDYKDERAAIPLYKMHGSVNWLFQTMDYYPPADQVSKKSNIWQIVNKQLGTDRVYYKPLKGRRWILFPLIVPPVYEKHFLIRTHLHEVWSNAEQALADASQVVFWGYSFPKADTHARHFFQSMSTKNHSLRHPVLINPDPQSSVELWSVLRPDYVVQFRDAQAYLADKESS
jgi:hypothetical protein